MNKRKRIRRKGSASFLAIVLILGTSFPASAMEELAENAKESENDDLVDIEPNIFNSSLDEILISFELEENKEQVGFYLRDHETEELLGIIEEFDDVDAEHHNHHWDLTVKDLDREETVDIEDGHYYIEIITQDNTREVLYQREEVLVHNDDPEVQLDPEPEEEIYHTEDNAIQGQIDSSLLEYEIVEDAPDAHYTLEQDEEIYHEEALALSEEGEFEINDVLNEGLSTLTIEITDEANNQGEEQFEVELVPEEDIDEEIDEEIGKEEERTEEETEGDQESETQGNEDTDSQEEPTEEASAIQVQSNEKYQDGDSGEHVVELKQDLTRLGFGNFPSDPSTTYGSVTTGVVEDFQSHYGLDITGNANEETLNKIEEVLTSPYQDGESGDHVVELKEDLTRLGFGNFPSDPSTSYGSVTEGVVEDFQEAQGLPASGIADEITLATISDLLAPPYQVGDRGEHVVVLKENLTALGFGNFPSEPSINYGSVTEGVVEDFQSYYGLDVTGHADEATLEKIEEVLSSSYQDGNSGDHVVELKEDLTRLGFGSFPSDPSTVYGSVTEGVVKDFQEAQGLPVSGIADEITLETMNEILTPPYQDGDRGQHVVVLKENLTALGFGNFPSDPSTTYGSVTTGVVEDFQSHYGLDVTGDADEATLEKMDEVLSSSYQDGNSGDHVVELKEDLTRLGFGSFPSDPSTTYGSVTEGVVKEFQEAQGLPISGIADEVTLETISEILAPPYQDGDRGEHIVELKKDLTTLGFGNFPAEPSTGYGSVTTGVVEDFQSYYGLDVTGAADEATLAKMDEVLSSTYQDGESGDYVVELKEDLTRLGFGNFPSSPSTSYGPVTEGVVKDFQAHYGLVTNGIADDRTLAKLEEILDSSYQDGESGDYVVELKEDLTRLGFGNFPSSPSTSYGPVTEGVVKEFQEAQGLPVSGIADEITLETIHDILSPPYQDGDRGEHIVELKEDLTALGFGNFPEHPSTGYGSVTTGVVEDFQSYYGLDVTGITDEETLDKIEEVLDSPYQDGERGDYVVELKEDLTRLGFGNFPSSPSTGYGSVTEGVVKDFQVHYGLVVNGIADEITLSKMEEILESPYQDGERGDYVVELKEDLTALGFGNFPASPSVVYGSVTEGVVKDFQEAVGLPVSGIADEITLEKIESMKDGVARIFYTDYNSSVATMVNIQAQVNPQSDSYGRGWQTASAAEIRNNVDPNRFTLDPDNRDMYQFLVLSETSGVPVSYLDNELKEKGALTGTGQAFSNAANKYSINEFYLLSHAMLETGNGGSVLSNGSIRVGKINNNTWVSIQPNGTYIAMRSGTRWSIQRVNNFDERQASNLKSVYNVFGIGAVDSSPSVRGSIRAYEEGWFSPEEAIEGGTQFIAESYVHHPTHQQDTLYKMRWNPNNPGTHQYATDVRWALKQTNNIYRHYQELGSLRKSFDIPRYN